MNAERKIIVGYDPDHRGGDTLQLSRLFSEVLAAKRIVITALPWPSYLTDQADLDAMAAKAMEDRFSRLRDAEGDPELETRAIPSTSAALALNVAAEDEGAEMIVLGSCHRGPVGRTLLGSVGESLMHGAPCAIAVAPIDYAERQQHRLLHVAVAYDGSDEAQSALDAAIALVQRTRGRLTILTVADFPDYGYAMAFEVLTEGEVLDADRKRKTELLQEALDATPQDVGPLGRVLVGNAGSELCDVSGEFDLMLAGSRAFGAVHRTFLGSTTRKLIRSSECPVLVLPRGTQTDPLALKPQLARAGDSE